MAKQGWQLNIGRRRRAQQGISSLLQEQTRERILRHAAEIVPEKASQLRVWFRGRFCYIDAQEPDSSEPFRLCRLRYAGSPDRWTLAFYTYSRERYERCVFMSGDSFGTPEEALEIGAVYLQ